MLRTRPFFTLTHLKGVSDFYPQGNISLGGDQRGAVGSTAFHPAIGACPKFVREASRLEGARLPRNTLKHQTAKAGLSKTHGLRHQYAQRRYLEETGFACPAAGGPTSRQLAAVEKARDRETRLRISRELGHEHEQITAVYLGR